MIPVILAAIIDDGDRRFMDCLYRDYLPLMLRHARKFESTLVPCEDIVQQACLRLLQHIKTLQKIDCCKWPSYIVSTVRSSGIDLHRKAKGAATDRFADKFAGYEDTIGDETSLEDDIIDKLSLQEMKQAILALPEHEQYLLRAKYILQYSDQEIADVIGINPSSVRTYLFRARRKVLAALRGRQR